MWYQWTDFDFKTIFYSILCYDKLLLFDYYDMILILHSCINHIIIYIYKLCTLQMWNPIETSSSHEFRWSSRPSVWINPPTVRRCCWYYRCRPNFRAVGEGLSIWNVTVWIMPFQLPDLGLDQYLWMAPGTLRTLNSNFTKVFRDISTWNII